MAEQDVLQNLIQKTAGTHTAGQTGVPSSAATGNPNGVYNWSSYAVTPGNPPQFNLQSVDVPASQPGYTPPFAADPYLAAALAGVPQAQSNEHVDRVLSRLFSGNNNWGYTPGPGNSWGPTTPTTPGTPPPGGPGTPPPGTPGYQPPGAGPPTFVGPISGPVTNNPHNWRENYANAQPNTNLIDSGLGRQYSMDWLRTNLNQLPNQGRGQVDTGDGFVQGIRNLFTSAGNTLRGVFADTAEEAGQFFDDLIGREGWQGVARAIGLLAGIPGMETLLPRSYDSDWTLSPETLSRAEDRMAASRDALVASLTQRGGDAAYNNVLNNLINQNGWTREQAEEWYNQQQEMTDAEWRRQQESFQWNNFWNSHGQGTTRNPVTGLPAMDLIDDMINNIAAPAVNWEAMMRNRWTRHR